MKTIICIILILIAVLVLLYVVTAIVGVIVAEKRYKKLDEEIQNEFDDMKKRW